jgi:exopolyphosphatase/pppGpp-phosphohydrolase
MLFQASAGNMMTMSNQMSEMMGKMSGMMKDMPKGNMKTMSGVMKDLSQQMMKMSTALDGGKISGKEMKKMQDRMMEIEKRMSGMEMHK